MVVASPAPMNSDPTLLTRATQLLRAQAPRLVASLVIAGGFIWLFRRGGLPLIPPRSSFDHLEPWAIPVYAPLIGAAVWFRVHRWVYLLHPIAPQASRPRVIGVGLVGIAAILFAP